MSVQRVLPTLTEVIEIDPADLPQRLAVAALPPESVAIEDVTEMQKSSQVGVGSAVVGAAVVGADESDSTLATQLEERVQALLAPRLARLVDSTLQSVRADLAAEVQVLVRQAIEEALAQKRQG